MNQRGQVLAEFAVASLAALLMFFGILDFARALYTYHLVAEGARLATRYAIVNSVAACAGTTPDPLQAYVAGTAFGTTPSLLVVTTTCPGGNTGCSSTASPYNGTGCLVSVTVTYSFHFIAPIVSLLVIPMTSRSQMVISQ
ncbi:MAG: TadE/TadG family type IV pilus assembly protein [Vulcanimicrobiaceae bacterium]